MEDRKIKKQFTQTFLFFVIIICIIFFIIFSPQISSGIKSACERCLNVIIPSLFLFTAVCAMLTESGGYAVLSKPFSIISKYLYGIPAKLFFVFIMGNLAGYPIGIKLLADLKNQGVIDEKTAKCMSAFCYCGGPAFYGGAVGLAVFSDKNIGIMIFLSILIANSILAIFICHIVKPKFSGENVRFVFSSQILVNSVLSAGRTMFTVCAMIIFSSAIISTMEAAGLFKIIEKITGNDENITILIKSLFEISYIAQLKNSPFNLLPFVTACCSFGGICVILQIVALNHGSFSLKYFFIARPILAILSGSICKLLCEYFVPQAVYADSCDGKLLVNFNNFIPSICLILMILLLNMKKRLVILNQICYNKKSNKGHH